MQVPEACKPDFPFIVNVLDPIVQTHECTGVLIDRRTVIVPASCVKKEPRIPSSFPLVRLGSYNLNAHDGDEPEEVSLCSKTGYSNSLKTQFKKSGCGDYSSLVGC